MTTETEVTTETTGTTESTEQTNTEAVAPEVVTGEQTTESTLLSEGEPAEATTLESYEAFTMPEGIAFDAGMLDKFTDLAKGTSLNQEQAQKFIDLANDHVGSALEKQNERWTDIRKEWIDDLKSDKEYGGPKFGETVTRAKRALGKFGSPEFTEFLETTGYGDNAELVKMLARIDKAIGEDTLVEGGPSNMQGKNAAQVIYPVN